MSSSASNQFLNPVSQVDLARWGLLDEVRRQQRQAVARERSEGRALGSASDQRRW